MRNIADLIIGYTLWPQIVVPIIAWYRRASIIICPNYVFPILCGKKCIVIVHDISFITDREPHRVTERPFFSLMESMYFSVVRMSTKIALARAGGVIVSSEKVRQEITRNVRTVSAQIFVVPWGVDRRWAKESLVANCEPNQQPYVLCVNPHNINAVTRVITALSRYNCQSTGILPSVKLKLVGHLRDVDDLPPLAEYLGRVEDSELARLYTNALVVAIAATNGGFGLPLLEALASGCPCIVTKGTAEAEVADGNGVYEIVDDVESWASAIARVISNPIERQRRSEEGRSWANLFTWERVGEQLSEAIETVRGVHL